MDTSKEYVKMCDKSGLEECCSYGIPAFIGKVKYTGNNVFVELDQCSTTWRTVRLLRQSQIQEMFKTAPFVLSGDFDKKMENYITGNPDNWSFEMLWLAFYMFEKHQKIWDGKEWVKK